MFDYDREYGRLKECGLPGWGGGDRTEGWTRALAAARRDPRFPAPPARLLELGCGNGIATLIAAQAGYDVTGVEHSGVALAWAAERFAAAGRRGAFHRGDVAAMPFLADAGFDAVIDGNCLHCLIGERRPRCLAEVRRVLRPGGAFLVSSMVWPPKSEPARASYDAARGCLLRDGAPYRTLKPAAEIADEVRAAGFRVASSAVSVNPWWDHLTMLCLRPAAP